MAEVRRVVPADSTSVFNQLAEIHRKEIHEGFLSTLGDRFLVRLYTTLANANNSFVFASFEGDKMLGFIVGAMDTGAVYKEFARKAGLSSFVALLPKLFSLARIRRILETLLYPKKKQADDLPEPEILNFCVRSETQGQGVGGRLFEELCAEFSRRGVPRIRIVTGESQRSAQTFYERKGAHLAAETEVHKDTKSRIYVFDIVARA